MLCNFCILAATSYETRKKLSSTDNTANDRPKYPYTNHAIKCYHSRRPGLRPSLLGYKSYVTFYILLNYIILTNNK